MKLPVTTPGPDAATLWRRYADLLFDRMLAVGEDVPTAAGRAVTDGTDAFVLLREDAAADAIAVATDDLRPHGVTRTAWAVPPGGPEPADGVVGRVECTLRRLNRFRPAAADAAWAVLPGRAARDAYARTCRATDDPADPWSPRRPAHLDDPQFDGLLALDGRTPLAVGGLQTRGHSGGVFDLAVVPEWRRRGVGRFLLGRVLELAARSQLSDVLAGTAAGPAAELFEAVGFLPVTRYAIVTTSNATD